MQYKFAVLGTSEITKHLLSGAKLTDNLTLTGVYSRSYEKGRAFADGYGAENVYTSLSELAESDAEFIYVASPNSCHYEQCRFLLSRGKSVICEKPITVTEAEFLELSQIADNNSAVYFEAIMYMHNPVREDLKATVEKIGKISSAHIDFSQLSSRYAALRRGELPNIFNPLMKAGALNDLGVYCVYPCVDLFGLPEKITPSQLFLSTGADGAGSAIFSYPDKEVTVTYSKVGQSRLGSEIIGDSGTVTIGSISQLTNIDLYNNSGEKTVISGEMQKARLMNNELVSMLSFLENPETTKDFYLLCRERSREVLSVMEKMRVKNA